MDTRRQSTEKILLLTLTLAALGVSAVRPFDWGTWVLEVFPVFIGLALLVPTHKSFPLTPVLYRLLFVHALILILGGHYSYARVPLGDWLRTTFEFDRNPYDRIGHLAQGFVPAILTRELLLRKTPLRPGGWLVLLCTAVCLGFSALYELFEWATAVAFGGGATEFLGTQGDVWDAQWDMFMALIGALISLTLLSRVHQKQLESLR